MAVRSDVRDRHDRQSPLRLVSPSGNSFINMLTDKQGELLSADCGVHTEVDISILNFPSIGHPGQWTVVSD